MLRRFIYPWLYSIIGVANLFHPNEVVLVSPASRLAEFTTAHLRTTKWRRMGIMEKQIIINKMPRTSEDTPSEEMGNVGNCY